MNAVHTAAPDARDTDWSQIVALYDRLVAIDPSPRASSAHIIPSASGDTPAQP